MKKVILLIMFLIVSSELRAQTPYYQGKTIKLVQGREPGGSGDIRSRAVIPFLRKYIPGHPTIVNEYMPGGGGRKAANYLFNTARPDGLTIGLIAPALYQAQLVGRPEVKFNWADFGWIGTGEGSAYQIYIRTDTGHKTLEDLRRTKEPARCAESALGSMNYAYIRLIEEVFQANFSPILG